MHLTLIIAFFTLGTIIASAVNALAQRRQADLPWGGSQRSICPHCGKTLTAVELVPLFSFLFQTGSCAGCGKPIGWRYPLVELAGGGLFLLSFFTFGFTLELVFSLLAMSLLLFMYIYDAETLTLPNPAVWSFNLLAFSSLFVVSGAAISTFTLAIFTIPSLWALAAGPLISLPFFALWVGSRGRAMGFGDVKLALGIGWFLGIAGGLSAVMYSFWIGAVVSVGLLLGQRLWKSNSPNASGASTMKKKDAGVKSTTEAETEPTLTLKSAVPFGPFLILGFLLVYFGQIMLF